MKVINLFAGPGAGKSTIASDLFALMKWNKFEVELINEYAKDLTWEENLITLQDQLYVTASQNRKLWRLRGKVDYVITDSPLLLSTVYTPKDYMPNHFSNMVNECFNMYENINFYIKREKDYNPNGRSQTEDEAREIDSRVLKMLDKFDHKYHVLLGNKEAKNEIFNYIMDMK